MSTWLTFGNLAWAFVGAVALHNLEEALFLPAWSQRAGNWHAPVGVREFRFAVATLTVLAALLAFLAVRGHEAAIYILCGYGLAMLLNVLVPHVAATLASSRYAPGTATALMLNLPVCLLLIGAAHREHLISWARFAWTGPLTILGILALIPILFRIGRVQS